MSKYEPLKKYLIDSKEDTISISFDEIADILNEKLPPSAFNHRAWWSNNESNSVITRAWLAAGYKTRNVDISKCTLEFYKCSTEKPLHRIDTEQFAHDREGGSKASQSNLLSRVSGILKGTVTVYPETDLTEPLANEWDASR